MSTAEREAAKPPRPQESAEMTAARQTGPCVMVIFGATGDLTARKLLPALYNLAKGNLLSREFAIVGLAREQMSEDQFRDQVKQSLYKFVGEKVEESLLEWLVRRLHYVSGDFGDAQVYARLREYLAQVDKDHATHGNYFFYLATSPVFFAQIIEHLGAAGLAEEANGAWRRVVIEKPFGHDLESAQALNREIKKVLYENQIYRIDHYLGKETVQNILLFRFSNGIFEPIWNRRYIDHVQISVAETVGVEQRGGYFDNAGTLRDMVPNHLFQLVSLTAMEPPISFSANAVRSEQAKTLNAVQGLSSEDVITHAVRGQYGEGGIAGERVKAYRAEPNVAVESKTETFVALKLLIDNWRWADVPFYLRTGKRLAMRYSEIAIQFKRAPFVLFRDTPVEKLTSNLLVLHIAPDEGISLRFGAKIPGPQMRVGAVDMNFNYCDYFGTSFTTGYEILLYDGIIGDATLFQSTDMVEAGWAVVDPILDVWKALPPRSFPNYASGSWGPKEANELLERDGRHWRSIGDDSRR
ncbi:MAG TPA: glucose-6-phosphate dehydrogenase [Terriglobales bacterium]|nr:glucose-6-phosphate dehydrogenase [Terriglobales bacterium]